MKRTAQIEILKLVVEEKGMNFKYKSDDLDIAGGIIKQKSNFLDSDTCKYLVEKGFTITQNPLLCAVFLISSV